MSRKYLHIVLLTLFWKQVHVEAVPTCSSSQILCKSASKCISISYICDGDNDCGDGTDESFCDEWTSTTCSRGEEKCTLPSGSNSCMPIKDYCEKTNPPCEGPVDPRICYMMLNGAIQRLSEVVLPTTPIIRTTTEATTQEPKTSDLMHSETKGKLLENTANVTMRHPECPTMYTRAGDKCISFFYLLKLTWGEAEAFCNIMNGTLVELSDYQSFVSIHNHLDNIRMTSDFWIGARYLNETGDWRWLSDRVVEIGSPLWGVRYSESCIPREEDLVDFPFSAYWTNKTACYHYTQAPDPNTNNFCAALTFRHFHYITDEDCMMKKSPLCMVGKNKSNSPALREINRI